MLMSGAFTVTNSALRLLFNLVLDDAQYRDRTKLYHLLHIEMTRAGCTELQIRLSILDLHELGSELEICLGWDDRRETAIP